MKAGELYIPFVYNAISSLHARTTSDASSSSSKSRRDPTWDTIFDDLDPIPPMATIRAPHKVHSLRTELRTPSYRRQSLTARETSIFQDMFSLIFDAVAQKNREDEGPLSDVGIGRRPSGTAQSTVTDLYGKVRRHAKGASKGRRGAADEEEIDILLEEMMRCRTDQELLNWLVNRIFKDRPSTLTPPVTSTSSGISTSPEAPGPGPPPLPETETLYHLSTSPAAYARVITEAIAIFRDKYNDPYLALSVFDHARRRSVLSFVLGCTTPAYNELLITRWSVFRDLKGVADALEEMKVNGVLPDNQTRKIVETVRKEVGERNLWQEPTEETTGIWSLLRKIETYSKKPVDSREKEINARGSIRSTRGDRRTMPWDEVWKSDALGEGELDALEFAET